MTDPIVGIPEPPEMWRPSHSLSMLSNRTLWQFPREMFDKIWEMDFSNVTIAILDTGVNPHADLPRPVFEASMISGESPRDGNGHGTHCAGTALGRNAIGFCHNAKLINIKVLSNSGSGSSSGIAKGVDLAVENGADVISLSLGSNSGYDPTRVAGEVAAEKGVACVAAAGNAGNGSGDTDGFPARYTTYHSVGALADWNTIARFSSRGRSLACVAPGQNIVSCGHRGGYTSMSGTSMATPWMAGMWGAIISKRRSEGEVALKGADAQAQYLKKYQRDLGSQGWDRHYGDGVVDPYALLKDLVGDGELS